MDTMRELTRTTRVLLVLAPALILAGGTTLVRYDDQDWPAVLTAMAAGRGSSDLGWVLALLGSALAVLPALALAGLARPARPRAAAAAGVLLALGWAGCVAIAQGGITMSALAVSPARAEQVAVLKDLNAGAASNVAFLFCVLGAIGGIVLAVALARSRVVPTGAAVLLGLGTAGSMLVMAGPVRALLLLAAALLLAGGGWVAAVARAEAPAGAPQPVTA